MRRLLIVSFVVSLSAFHLASPISAHDFIGAKDQLIHQDPVPDKEAKAFEQVPEGPRGTLKGVLDSLKVWPVGFQLQACFMGGADELRQFFADAAKAWTEASNISFDFGSGPSYRSCQPLQNSHIRIAFKPSGNWSYVGIDSNAPDVQKQASLNIGDAAGRDFAVLRKERLRGVVLHELGHALGLHHEHQSPQSKCEEEFDWPAIEQGLGGPPNNWSKETIDHNLRRLVTSPRYQTTAYDPKSIMHYSLPVWMFKAGQNSPCFVPENTTLSESDRAIMRTAYPASKPEQQQYLTASGERIENALREAGLTQEQAAGLAELAKAVVGQSHPNMSFGIKIENLRKEEKSQEDLTQTIEGDKNIGVQGVQDSTVDINGGN